MGGKGSGGRNRKPTAIKKAQGNPGKRKLNEKEPKPKSGIPEMPKGLPPLAVAEWKRIVPILDEMGVLNIACGPALAAYCSSFNQWFLAEAAIQKFGILCAQLDEVTGVAVLKINPAVRVKSDALRHMKSFAIEFGLTPGSLSRLTTKSNDSTQDPLDDFLGRKTAGETVQ